MGRAIRIKYPYVEKRAGVCGGRAVLKGTRIPVWIIFERYRGGQAPEEIHAAYPHLSLSQIHEALAYAFDYLPEIQNDLQANRENTWRRRLKALTATAPRRLETRWSLSEPSKPRMGRARDIDMLG